MDVSDLRRFVVKAHRNGYASAEARETADGIKRVEYERDEWRYVDRYVGSRDFVGFEVVRRRGEPVWGMNYFGYLLESADAGRVYDFLRTALEDVSDEYPFRGPPLAGDAYRYENQPAGDVEQFHGRETIERSDRTVYEGFYRGGRIR